MTYEVDLIEANRGLTGHDLDFMQIESITVRVQTSDAESAVTVARRAIAEKYQGQWMAVKVVPHEK